MKNSQNKRVVLETALIAPLLFLLVSLAGCGETIQPILREETKLPSPTLHRLFDDQGAEKQVSTEIVDISGSVPTVADLFTKRSTTTPSPTVLQPSAAAAVRATPLPEARLVTVEVYDDELNSNWEVLEKEGMNFDLDGAPTSHQGRKAISAIPTKGFGKLFFAVKQNSDVSYPRSQILGISFWVNGGKDYIGIGDLAVTAVGSNLYPYWVASDRSVYQGEEFPFSETRLYYLGFNRSIPPHTWIKVEVWLDELIFDPYYDYMTGFYIKNDKAYLNTFYVDDVSLVMLEAIENTDLSEETTTPGPD